MLLVSLIIIINNNEQKKKMHDLNPVEAKYISTDSPNW